jgi:hypothetical protein
MITLVGLGLVAAVAVGGFVVTRYGLFKALIEALRFLDKVNRPDNVDETGRR